METSTADSRDEGLSMVIHELKNPLQAARCALSVASLRASKGMEVRDLLQRADAQISLMARLIDDLYDVSRLRRGHLDLRPESCDLVSAVTAVASTFGETYPNARISVSAPDALPGWFDIQRIEQLVNNLLVNAIKYAGDQCPISLTLLKLSTDMAVLAVSDEGPGISDEALSTVFEAFARGQVDADIPGMGVGLWMVNAIAALHGGATCAVNGKSGGTSVLTILPCSSAGSNRSWGKR